MDNPEKRRQLQGLATEIFEISGLASKARAQARGTDGVEALTETEYLALDQLSQHEVMTVGEIQKAVGVLPAQMSRIVRSLEEKGGSAFINCRINPDDRRKIDVSITEQGSQALEAYRAARMNTIVRILSVLDENERSDFMRICRKIREHFQNSLRRK